MTGSHVPPGWYPDPWGQAPLRWWDGTGWSPHVSWAGAASVSGAWQATPDVSYRMDTQQRWAMWHRRGLLVWPFVAALSFVVTAGTFSAMGDALREAIDNDNPDAFGTGRIAGWQGLSAISSPLSVGLLVLRLVWFGNAVATARRVGLGGSRSTGLAVAGWLIPIVNLWWPYQDTRDLTPPGDPARRHLKLWWTAWLCSSLGLLVVLPVALFDPGWSVLGPLCAVLSLPAFVAAYLERALVADVVASHRRALPAPAAT